MVSGTGIYSASARFRTYLTDAGTLVALRSEFREYYLLLVGNALATKFV